MCIYLYVCSLVQSEERAEQTITAQWSGFLGAYGEPFPGESLFLSLKMTPCLVEKESIKIILHSSYWLRCLNLFKSSR